MRYQRLILEASSAAETLTFHPRLTVIAGLSREQREGMISELLGVMAGVRRDTRLDLLDDAGRHLSVRRAATPDRDKVLNTDDAHEVSLEFLNGGNLDLLHGLGLNLERARRRCRLSPADITAVSRGETLVTSLAARNQGQLWAAADRVRAAETTISGDNDPDEVTGADVIVMEAIERTHAAFDAAHARHETVRHHGLLIGGISALAAVLAAARDGWLAIPFVAVALVAAFIAIFFRRRMQTARSAEHEALAEAGATSYVGFHMQKLTDRLERDGNKPSLKGAASEYREAMAAWQAIAGGASADWAFARRETIGIATERLATGGRLPVPSEFGDGGPGQPSPAELAEALIVRLADLRHVGPDEESLPLILDEPFVGIDLPVKQWMLELVARAAGSPQVVYLTDDEDVVAWARIEAMAGQLGVVEPLHAIDRA